MTRMKSLLLTGMALLLLALASTGCNTVRGAGEDIQSVGDTVTGNTPPPPP